MKKKILFIITLIMVITLTGCGKKTALTKEEFNERLINEGFVITEITKEINDSNIVYAAAVSSNDYQFEYHIYKNNDACKKSFNSNKKAFESGKTKKDKEKIVNGENYDKYSITSFDEYKSITRVDNTFVYASLNVENKDSFNKALKALGY